MSRTIVYTAIMGGYDHLPEIISKDEQVEFYCFTDSIPQNTNGWTCIQVQPFFKDNKLNIGYLKTNAELLFPWDSVVVWVDSNIGIIELSRTQIFQMIHEQPVATLLHRQRQTVFGEIAVVAEYNLDNKHKLAKWEVELKSLGYPDDNKLAELNFLVRDLRQPKVRQLNKTWWRFLLHGSRRDQLSFNPALWYHNMPWKVIKADNNSAGEFDFKYSFQVHADSAKRAVPNSSPSFDRQNFAPFCWTELHSSKNQSGEQQEHYLYQQEFWTEETLVNLKEINKILEEHQKTADENYCFIQKENIHEYSVPDLRYGWKREYFRKAILPAQWVIEVGFRQGHSAAIALGYNPYVKILAIEAQPDEVTKVCANKLVSIYPNRLELHYDNTATVFASLQQKAALEKIELVHYNTSRVFNAEEFWGFIEWYLCRATIGCRLLISDINKEVNSVMGIVYSMALVDYLNPGMPPTGDVQQMVKLAHMEPSQLEELKSWHQSIDVVRAEGHKFRTNNISFRKVNEALLEQNNELKTEVAHLRDYILKFEKPEIYFLRRVKRLIKKFIKNPFKTTIELARKIRRA